MILKFKILFVFFFFVNLFNFRSNTRRTSAELTAQTKTTWPIPITTLLFSPHFKYVTPTYLHQTYEFCGVIASGAFGIVYRVIDRTERDVFALKVLQKAQVNLMFSKNASYSLS